MRDSTKILLGAIAFIVFAPLFIMVFNLYFLVNLIESPLPESEEKLPDLGIVDN